MIYESNPMIVCPTFTVDSSLKICSINQVWGGLFFYADNLEELIVNKKQIPLLKNQMKLPLSDFPFQMELNLKGLKAEALLYTWIIVRGDENTFHFYGSDLGGRKELETRYERMYHSTTDAVMLLSHERFTDCNQATLKIFKFKSVDDFIKFHPADLSPPVQPDGESSLTKANRMIKIAFEEGRNFFEWMHRDSRGKDFLCEVLLSRIEINGEPYIQASVRDISERIKLQQALEETRIRQVNAARLASLGEMAGGIAHEINNPIAVIRGQAEILKRALKKNNDIAFFENGLEKIISTVDRITKIIKGLRAVSRDSSEDPMLEFDLIEIVHDTLNLFEEKLRVGNIAFDIEYDQKMIFVSCRPAEISQVILNLMNNSYDAVLKSEKPWIKILIKQKEDKIEMRFIDSGYGISKKDINKIFEPFYTTKDVGKGTGLGLSISKGIIERHGGELYLDIRADHTTFVINLPRIR